MSGEVWALIVLVLLIGGIALIFGCDGCGPWGAL